MSTKVVVQAHAEFVSVELDVAAADVVAIGKRMHAMNPEARMDGYNWDVFFLRYLEINYPELSSGLERDPEVNIYLALYKNNVLGNKQAGKLEFVINRLIANPDEIYAYMEEDGDGVEWID